ncbi:MAG TPA: fasciclin domain-containing protein [Acidocella sp.]|nr:MAG: fasciclin [Acidocella sp. 20-58-15]HQT38318.1 fasciclin domain-containing protein [Acidocella sp.]
MKIKHALLTATLLIGASGLAAAQSMSPMSGGSMSSGSMSNGAMSSNMASDPMVGGAAMYPTKNIIQNAVNSKDHTTLVAAVKAAGLVDTLEGPGPFTVFAPTNEAFAALPAGTVDTLLKPENKATLTKILTYHVVAGHYDINDLKALIAKGNGKAMLPTVAGPDLTFTDTPNGMIDVTDAKGDVAAITIPDVNQSNGVIQVINKVLLPG